MNPFFLYMLKCSDNSYYIGQTDNLEKRIQEHYEGKGDSYTSTRLPITLVFFQEFETREEALMMERKIKKWTRKKKEVLIEKKWNKLTELAKKKFNK